jgi:hypothetical protein
MKKVLAAVAMAAVMAAGSAQADIAMTDALASWNQLGQTGNQDSTAGINTTHITATSMNRVGGLSANAGVNSLNSATWTSGGYVEFGFTVDQGYHANLGSLYFGSKVSSTGPTNIVIKTSNDGFTNAFQTIAMNNTVTGTPYINNSVNLSSLAAIASEGQFFIRLYGTGASSAAGTMRVGDYLSAGTYYFDTITGTVAADTTPTPTPIPAAAYLLGSGLLGLVGIRRRQK